MKTQTTPQQAVLPPVGTPEAYNRFDDALSTLTTRYKVALVCESAPRVRALTPKQADALRVALAAPNNQSADAQIKAVAQAYDYEATRADAQTFRLQKRYTDPDDLPEVTLEEATFAFKNLMKAASPVYGDGGDEEAAVRNLVNSAGAERRKQLAKGIPIRDLPSTVRSLPWRLASMGSIQIPMDSVQAVTRRLHKTNLRQARFKLSNYLSWSLPAYEGVFGPFSAKWTVVLGYYMQTDPGGGTFFIRPTGVTVVDKKIVGEFTEPTTPDKMPPVPVPPSVFQVSLETLATNLNERIAKRGNSTPNVINGANALTRVKADKAIARKTVCLFGDEFASPSQLLQAVAAVYGLRIAQTKAGEASITLPIARPIGSSKEFVSEIARLLPAPYLRAMQTTWQIESESPIPRNKEPRVWERLYIASMKRLRTIIEPRIEAAENKTVPFSDAPDEARDLVGLSSMASCAPYLKWLMQPKPDFMDRMGDASFSIVVEDGRAVCSILVDRGKGLEAVMQSSIAMNPDAPPPVRPTPKKKN